MLKCMYTIPRLVKGYGPVDMYRDHGTHEGRYPESAVQRDSGFFEESRFEVHLWIRLMNGKDEPYILPVACIMEARDIDDWALTKMKVADGDWQDISYEFSPTRFVHRFWW